MVNLPDSELVVLWLKQESIIYEVDISNILSYPTLKWWGKFVNRFTFKGSQGKGKVIDFQK